MVSIDADALAESLTLDEEEEEDDYNDENEIDSDEIALQYTEGEEFEDFDGYTLEELETLIDLTEAEIALLEES